MRVAASPGFLMAGSAVHSPTYTVTLVPSQEQWGVSHMGQGKVLTFSVPKAKGEWIGTERSKSQEYNWI